jgi:uncharacterized protein (DUF1697 family)
MATAENFSKREQTNFMTTYIAMLRGINVSGHKIIKMESLRASFAALGFGDVKTYIQSGNVVFKTAKTDPAGLAKKIVKKIRDDFGFDVPVLVKTAEELAAVLKANPLSKRAGVDESKLHVTFLAAAAPKNSAAILQPLAAKSELFAVCGTEIYLHCPDGYGETKLANGAIEKKLSVAATTRNWKTVNVLHAMATASVTGLE